jgi:hypothetical protein
MAPVVFRPELTLGDIIAVLTFLFGSAFVLVKLGRMQQQLETLWKWWTERPKNGTTATQAPDPLLATALRLIDILIEREPRPKGPPPVGLDNT